MASTINASTSAGLVSTADTSGVLQLQTAGTAAVTVDASQNVGIGTSSPARKLVVYEAATGSTIQITDSVSGTSAAAGSIIQQSFADQSLFIRNYAPAGYIRFDTTGASEKMRLDASGNLLVGTTDNSTGNIFVINGSMAFNNGASIPQLNYYSSASTIEYVNRNSGGAKTYSWYYGASGSGSPATLSTSGVWTNASDARGKENVLDVNYGLATVLALKPRQYDVKSDGSHRIGFVAQELAEYVPEVIHVTMTDKEGSDWYGVDYGSITAVLVKAIQELKAEVDSLKSQLKGA